MPTDTKKRKIDKNGEIASTSGSGSASKDIKDLKKSLKTCDAPDLVQSLADSLDDASPETIQTLKNVLTPLIKAGNRPKHCVRCHNSYRESTNTIKSCAIKCAPPNQTNIPDEVSDRPWEYHMWQFPCCDRLADNDEIGEFYGDNSEDFDESDEDERPPEQDFGICFTAKHTTDSTSVKYYSPWREKKVQEKGVDYSGANKHVRTCKMMGCGVQTRKRSKKNS